MLLHLLLQKNLHGALLISVLQKQELRGYGNVGPCQCFTSFSNICSNVQMQGRVGLFWVFFVVVDFWKAANVRIISPNFRYQNPLC